MNGRDETQPSRDPIQLLTLVLMVGAAISGATFVVAREVFDTRIGALERDIGELERKVAQLEELNNQLLLRIADLAPRAQPAAPAGAAARPAALRPTQCGVSGATVRLCAGETETIGAGAEAVAIGFVRIDMTSGAARAFFRVRVGARPAQMIDGFAGEDRRVATSNGAMPVRVVAVETDPQAITLDISQLRS